ncbi:hypothetical protein TNCV_3781181 [Trichonephila clavipes]|nr:hypothetical protein TNCV_3781181 [Trichonephila clavipes]
MVANYPNEIISLDLLGPYPASKPDEAELVCGNIEKLFEETRQRTKIQQSRWASIIIDEERRHMLRQDEGDLETGRSSDEGSREAQGEADGREGLAREENTKVEQLRGKKKCSESSSTLHSEMQQQEAASKIKRRPQEKQNALKRAPPSLLQEDRTTKKLSQYSWKRRTAPQSLQLGPRTKRRPSGSSSKES